MRLHSSLVIEYANARKGVWEPLMEPCELQLLTQDNHLLLTTYDLLLTTHYLIGTLHF